MEKRPCYKSRGRFSIAVRYVLERAKNICVDGINFFHQMRRAHFKRINGYNVRYRKSDLI